MNKMIENEMNSMEFQEEEAPLFDFKQLWMLFVLNWRWFIASVVACVMIAYVYSLFQPNDDVVMNKIQIMGNSKQSGGAAAASKAVSGALNALPVSLGSSIGGPNDLETEKEVLSSKPLIRKVVKDLGLYAEYRVGNWMRTNVLYKTQPVEVTLDPAHLKWFDDQLPLVYHEIDLTLPSNRVDGRVYAIASAVELSFNRALTAGELNTLDKVETLTFNSGASGIQENLQHIYSTPYNYMPDGVRYYGSFEKEQKVPHVSLLLYHVAAKVDINWFVDEEKRSKTNMLRLTKMDACNLFNGNAFCFKPMENSLPALPTTTDSVHIVTRTDEGLWWEGRSYFYTIPYTTTGKTGYYPLQMQMETNESGAMYKPTVYLGVNTSSPFVPWLRATFNINNPLAAGTAEKTVSLEP